MSDNSFKADTSAFIATSKGDSMPGDQEVRVFTYSPGVLSLQIRGRYGNAQRPFYAHANLTLPQLRRLITCLQAEEARLEEGA